MIRKWLRLWLKRWLGIERLEMQNAALADGNGEIERSLIDLRIRIREFDRSAANSRREIRVDMNELQARLNKLARLVSEGLDGKIDDELTEAGFDLVPF